MKIGILCHASFGGSTRVATELALALRRREHEIHLFSLTPPLDWEAHTVDLLLHHVFATRQAKQHPAELYADWSPDECRAFFKKIVEVIANNGLDVLHFHYADPFALIAKAIKQELGSAAPRLVGTLHGTDVIIRGRDRSKRRQLAEALRSLDSLTAVSVDLARQAADLFALPALPKVIPNFIDCTRFQPHWPREPEISCARRKPRIIHISNFRPIKEPQRMARLFLAIRAQIEAELWLVGDGPEMAEVKAILAQSEAADDVYYWGLRGDVVPFLTQADLLLMTSQYESFCLVALEAMACGVPVLATRVGGIPEVVLHGETGWLFRPDEQRSAVAWAVNLLSNPRQQRIMRRIAIEHARRFETARIVQEYEALYLLKDYAMINS